MKISLKEYEGNIKQNIKELIERKENNRNNKFRNELYSHGIDNCWSPIPREKAKEICKKKQISRKKTYEGDKEENLKWEKMNFSKKTELKCVNVSLKDDMLGVIYEETRTKATFSAEKSAEGTSVSRQSLQSTYIGKYN